MGVAKTPKAVRDYAKEMPDEVREYFKRQGSKGGKLGGQARMEKLTPEERKAIAAKAAAARWAKKKEDAR